MSGPEEYETLVHRLNDQPLSRVDQRDRIRLAKELGLGTDELDSARESYADAYSDLIEEDIWLDWLHDAESSLALERDTHADDEMALRIIQAIEIAKRASMSCLSIPLLLKYSQLVIQAYCLGRGLSVPTQEQVDDEDAAMDVGRDDVAPVGSLQDAFSLDDIRTMCSEILSKARRHVSGSKDVFDCWRIFETFLLQLERTPDQLIVVEKLFLDQLAAPHLAIEETFQQYSRFVTRFDNQNYDASLPAANKIYSVSKTASDEREPQETALTNADQSVEAYNAYLSWELQVKNPNADLVRGLLDRLTTAHLALEQAWTVGLHASRRLRIPGVVDELTDRATKAVPQSSTMWCARMQSIERLSALTEAVDEAFYLALGTRLFEQSVEDLVRLYETRASAHRRELDLILENSEEGGGDLSSVVESILQEGLKALRKVGKAGDPYLRLEKYLLRLYERFGQIDQARALWQILSKRRSREYAVWTGWADFETRHNNVTKAHEVYVSAVDTKNVDYPEYLLDAWLSFEKQNGSLGDFEYAENKSARLREGIMRRRQREAAAQQEAAATQAQQAQPDKTSLTETTAATDGDAAKAEESRKRAASAEEEGQAAKRVKTSDSVVRDRENSTVFAIAPQSASAAEADFRKLFRDCGPIREMTVKDVDGKTIASIEFVESSSVLQAQTKDKKRLNEEEIEVHIAWQSCLYVTNFPVDYDQTRVEEMFKPFGIIFETRWPSKRFKSTRRFCYIQYVYPSSAQNALALHKKELDGGHPLSVMISDPNHRKTRTDAQKNACELRVGNLNQYTNEHDLSKLFQTVGKVKEIRLVKNDDGTCKGLAFVEMKSEHDAIQALNLNNAEVRKKHISVIIADQRQKGTAGTKSDSATFASRAVHVSGLLPVVTEAEIQQTFEKFGAVKKVVLRKGADHATVEFESPTTAGKVALDNDVQLGGQAVTVAPYTPKAASSSTSGAASASFAPRQAARGGLRGRGRARVGLGANRATQRSTPGAASAVAAPGVEAAKGNTQDDFRKLLG